MNLAASPYASEYQLLGWWRSLFVNELLVDSQPHSRNVTQGDSVSFYFGVSARRQRLNIPGQVPHVSYRWEKAQSDGSWTVAYGSNQSDTWTPPPLTVGDSGQYRVIANNGTGAVASDVFTINVSLTAGSPQISLSRPEAGTTISGDQTVEASVSAAVDRVEFYLDGVLQFNDTVAPFAWSWDTAQSVNGHRTLTAQAFGGLVESLVGVSAPITVIVINGATHPPDSDDHGNSSGQASSVTFGTPVQGFISSPSDVDWFKVEVTTPGVLAFELTVPGENDYDVELFGPDFAYIKGSYEDVGASEIVTHNATVTGIYYVRVYGYPVGLGSFSATNPYSIVFGKQPKSIAPVLITQYYEGTGTNKYIELTNISDQAVELDGWWLAGWHNDRRERWKDESRPTHATDLAGIVLQAKQSVVIGHNASVIPSNVAGFIPAGTIQHNGDDSVVLYSYSDGTAFNQEHIVDALLMTAANEGQDISVIRTSPEIGYDRNEGSSFVDRLGAAWQIVSLQTVNDAAFGEDEFLGSSRLGIAQESPPGPIIENQPISTATNSGGKAKFSVSLVSTAEVSYRWQEAYFDGTKKWLTLTDNEHYSGCKTANMTVKASSSLAGREYRVMVTNRKGRVFSNVATFIIDDTQPPLAISSLDSLPRASTGSYYSFALVASGGEMPYIWTHVSGDIPPGISLNANGVISGTPTVWTTSTFRLQVTDSLGQFTSGVFSLSVLSPYEQWENDRFTPAEIAGGGTSIWEDFDRDGSGNLLEYAFGGDPKNPDAASTFPQLAIEDGRLGISLWCDSTRTDLVYAVQVSSSLADGSWVDIAQSVGGGPMLPIESRSIVADPGTDSHPTGAIRGNRPTAT